MGGDEAKRLYQYFFEKVQKSYRADKVKNGVFQAMMEVALVNDGPVCIARWAAKKERKKKTSHADLSKVTLELNANPPPPPAVKPAVKAPIS